MILPFNLVKRCAQGERQSNSTALDGRRAVFFDSLAEIAVREPLVMFDLNQGRCGPDAAVHQPEMTSA